MAEAPRDTQVGSPEQQQDAAVVEITQNPETIAVVSQRDRSSISRFMAENQFGFARSNRFVVDITNAPGIKNLPREFSLMCEAAEFPGRDLTTADTRIYGPTYKSPNLSTYNDITLTVLCDYQMSEKRFFDDWVDYINPKTNFNFEFRENYVSEVIIRHYDETNVPTYSIKLNEAFPVSVSSLQASWGDDNIHRLQVTMTYRYWEQLIEPDNRTIDDYEKSRAAHRMRVQEKGFESGFGSPLIDGQSHRKKVLRTAEESTNRFRKVISEITNNR